MGFFPKNKVAPLQTEQVPETQHNNYFPSDTFYLCMPGKADFFVDHLLVEQSKQLQRIVDNEQEIDDVKEEISEKQKELLDKQGNLANQQKINTQLEKLQENLQALEIDKAYLGENGSAFIPAENYHTSAAEAIIANLANTQHSLTLIKINTPYEKLNMAVVENREVTRPNLLDCIESVKSISQEDIKKILTANATNPKKPKSNEINPVIKQAIKEVLADATEYKKSVIKKNEHSSSERKRPSASQNKRSSTSSRRLSVLPTILEKKYFKVIEVNPQTSIVFEEIIRGKNALNSPEPTPRIRKP